MFWNKKKKRSGEELVIFFASDLHGSAVCFKKFVNGAKFYGANLLVMGGDLTGKAVIPITEQTDGSFKGFHAGAEPPIAAEHREPPARQHAAHGLIPGLAHRRQLGRGVERDLNEVVELAEQLAVFRNAGKLLEAQRLEQRTNFDLEMMLEIGTCPGIENYSLYTSRRRTGERPACLIDYFPADFLVIVDESHASLPQINGMYKGDRSRKETLIDHGFRLPSALDNRPLKFDEWASLVPKAIYASATPGDWEIDRSGGVVVEQIIRPTGLIDPEVSVRPVKGQVDDLLAEIREREKKGERVLVTTLTKRMAEDLAEYLQSVGVRVRYMHSEVDTIERMVILRSLRLGKIDVLVGINLLREGLDLPEVSLVAILDADKEGFLRDARSLIQTIGRAARNVNSQAIMYADRITASMRRCIDETQRRRDIQAAHNEKHGITPETIRKSIEEIEFTTRVADARAVPTAIAEGKETYADEVNREEYVKILEKEMEEAAEALDFERAALLRDQLFQLKAGK